MAILCCSPTVLSKAAFAFRQPGWKTGWLLSTGAFGKPEETSMSVSIRQVVLSVQCNDVNENRARRRAKPKFPCRSSGASPNSASCQVEPGVYRIVQDW